MQGSELLIGIGGGVALLLWATRTVRTGIERAYGRALRNVLGFATRSRTMAFGTGLGVAAALQSSTAAVLLTTSCVAGGLLQSVPALAVVLGADVGSTLVVQVLSFDLAWLSPVLLLIGVPVFLSSSNRQARQTGRIIIGLGLMLLSLQLIIGASEPLRASETLSTLLAALGEEPILALLLAAMLTWLAHSSVAVLLLIMSLASVGVLPVALGFALVLGANVGSGIIPMALTLNQPRSARRVVLGNLLIRLIGALLALLLVGHAERYLSGIGSQAGRQIANFHTLFNLGLVALFLPLIRGVDWLTARMLPEAAAAADDSAARLENPSHLDQDLIENPPLALASATREVLQMADRVEAMLRYALNMFQTDDKSQLARLGKIDDEVDQMNAAIKHYLVAVSRKQLSEDDSRRCMEIATFTMKLEHIGDIVEKNLLTHARKKIKRQHEFSEQGWRELSKMHSLVVENMRLALNVFISEDRNSARQLIEAKEDFRDLEHRYNQRHMSRLRAGQLESIETSSVHLDMMRDLKQINSLLASVAYPILLNAGELLDSRLKSRLSDDEEVLELDED